MVACAGPAAAPARRYARGRVSAPESPPARPASAILGEPVRLSTLAFRDGGLEAEFRSDYARRSLTFVRIGALCGLVVHLGYGAIDWTFVPDRFALFAGLRAAGVVAVAGVLGLTFARRARPWLQTALTAVLLVIGGTVAAMTLLAPAAIQYSYYIGLIQLTMAAYALVRLRFTYALAAGWGIFALYLVCAGAIPGEERPIDAAGAAPFLGTNAIGMVTAYVLEWYARTSFLQERAIDRERRRSEDLLHAVLPARIAERLKTSRGRVADHFEGVTVIFSDIVGFTPLAESMEPSELVRVLDGVFSAFDRVVAERGVEKIKTIGDAYMAAAGVPVPREDHAEAAAAAALAMRDALERIRAETGLELDVRIGLCSGPLVAGVIGENKFLYDLWGDTVNVASRMESSGVAGKIQVTEELRGRLGPAFTCLERGPVEVKGKGVMTTYWLEDGSPG